MLSVIVPCYQSEQTIAETLRSLQRQTFSEWECIVVNDGSTDDGPRIASEIASTDLRIRVLHKPNGGVSSARNAGIAAAAGEVLHFLDADDVVFPHAYELLLAGLEREPHVDVCYCTRYDRVDGEGKLIEQIQVRDAVDFKQLCNGNVFPIHAGVVRSRMLKLAGVFDGSHSGLEDWDFWLRIARAGGRFSSTDHCLVQYRQVSNSISSHPCSMYLDTLRVLDHLAGPDPRVAGALPELANGVAAPHLAQLRLRVHSSYLGLGVTEHNDSLIAGVVEKMTESATGSPQGPKLDVQSFCYGLESFASPSSVAQATHLPEVLRRCFEGIRCVEDRLHYKGLLEEVIETLLRPLRRAARERDQFLESTSYRLCRVFSQWKPWLSLKGWRTGSRDRQGAKLPP